MPTSRMQVRIAPAHRLSQRRTVLLKDGFIPRKRLLADGLAQDQTGPRLPIRATSPPSTRLPRRTSCGRRLSPYGGSARPDRGANRRQDLSRSSPGSSTTTAIDFGSGLGTDPEKGDRGLGRGRRRPDAANRLDHPRRDRRDRALPHRHLQPPRQPASDRTGQAWSDISVQLKQRHDLVPNLVETVKGYAAHERGTLEAVVQARNAAVAATGPAAQAQAENMLSGALRQLFALSEAYPQPQGQRELPAAAGRALRHREQDRRRAPLLQQRRPGIQRLDPAVPGRPHRRPAGLHASAPSSTSTRASAPRSTPRRR